MAALRTREESTASLGSPQQRTAGTSAVSPELSTAHRMPELLATLAATDSSDREHARAERDLMRLCEAAFRSIALRYCTQYGLDRATYVDDLTSEVRIVALTMIRDRILLTDHRGQPLGNWLGYVNFEAGKAVKKLVESAAITGVSGMSNRQRKSRALASARADLRRILGREPSPAEIVAHHNEKLPDQVSAARHGRLASLGDLEEIRAVPLPDNQDTGISGSYVDDHDSILLRLAIQGAAEQVIAAAEARSPRFGETARARYGAVAANPPGELRTVPEVAARTGSSYDMAHRRVYELDLLLREVLRQDYGIGQDS